MALDAGTISVSSTGVVSGTGLAKELYDARVTAVESVWGSINDLPDPLLTKRSIAARALADANAQVDHLKTNGKAFVEKDSLGAGVPAGDMELEIR